METERMNEERWEPVEAPVEYEQHHEAPDALLHEVIERSPEALQEFSKEEVASITAAFEGSKEIEAYRKGTSPIDVIEEGLADAGQQLQRAEVSPTVLREVEEKGGRFLDAVKEAVHNYGKSVRAFERTKIAAFHLEQDKYRNQLERHDRARRAAHEALIDAMRIYNRYVSVTLRRNHGVEVDHHKLFADLLFHNRDLQSAWALTTDYYLRAKHLVESLKHEENG